jgi:hypothetical protein
VEEEDEEEEDEDAEGDTSSCDSDMDSDPGAETRSRQINDIVRRLEKRDNPDASGDSSAEEDDEDVEAPEAPGDVGEKGDGQQCEEQQDQGESYPPGSFVVVIYQNDWYVGKVLEKEGEPEAEEGDQYLFVSFMQRLQGDHLKWPSRLDLLNVLKDDVLFACVPPTPSASTSSSRVSNLALSKEDLKKAKQMFLESKGYYPTNCILYLSIRYWYCT